MGVLISKPWHADIGTDKLPKKIPKILEDYRFHTCLIGIIVFQRG